MDTEGALEEVVEAFADVDVEPGEAELQHHLPVGVAGPLGRGPAARPLQPRPQQLPALHRVLPPGELSLQRLAVLCCSVKDHGRLLNVVWFARATLTLTGSHLTFQDPIYPFRTPSTLLVPHLPFQEPIYPFQDPIYPSRSPFTLQELHLRFPGSHFPF